MQNERCGEPISVLVVDDDPLMFSAIRRAVGNLPVRMRFASSAEEAQRMIEAEVPSLIISDYQMPGMDGVSFLERVKSRHPTVSCVLHTAVTKVRKGSGADIHVLHKPCPAEVWRDLITAAAAA